MDGGTPAARLVRPGDVQRAAGAPGQRRWNSQEWRSQVLPRHERMTKQVEALIAGAYLSGTNTRRVRRALGALFNGAVSKDTGSAPAQSAAGLAGMVPPLAGGRGHRPADPGRCQSRSGRTTPHPGNPATRPTTLCYSSPWCDLRRHLGADSGSLHKPEITPPSISTNFATAPDAAGMTPQPVTGIVTVTVPGGRKRPEQGCGDEEAARPALSSPLPAELISHAVWLYHVFSLSFRDVELILAERGVTVSYESIRRWCRSSARASPTAFAGVDPGPEINGIWMRSSSGSR